MIDFMSKPLDRPPPDTSVPPPPPPSAHRTQVPALTLPHHHQYLPHQLHPQLVHQQPVVYPQQEQLHYPHVQGVQAVLPGLPAVPVQLAPQGSSLIMLNSEQPGGQQNRFGYEAVQSHHQGLNQGQQPQGLQQGIFLGHYF